MAAPGWGLAAGSRGNAARSFSSDGRAQSSAETMGRWARPSGPRITVAGNGALRPLSQIPSGPASVWPPGSDSTGNGSASFARMIRHVSQSSEVTRNRCAPASRRRSYDVAKLTSPWTHGRHQGSRKKSSMAVHSAAGGRTATGTPSSAMSSKGFANLVVTVAGIAAAGQPEVEPLARTAEEAAVRKQRPRAELPSDLDGGFANEALFVVSASPGTRSSSLATARRCPS